MKITVSVDVEVGELCRPHKKDASHFKFSVGIPKQKRRIIKMLELTITDEQKVKVTLTPVTSSGKPAKVDGFPTWAVSTGDATLDVAADGLSAFLISGNLGDSTIIVDADADLGGGVESIQASITLHVEGAKATSLGLVAEAPVSK